jgi:hypothetical protein
MSLTIDVPPAPEIRRKTTVKKKEALKEPLLKKDDSKK